MDDVEDNSIPCSSTLKSDVFNLKNALSETIKISVPVSVPVHPYRLAVLTHHNYNLKKRWYVTYYAWDVQLEKLVRVRQADPLNRIKSIQKRLAVAGQLVDTINYELLRGKCLGRQAAPITANAQHDLRGLKITEAIQYYIEQKKLDGLRPNSLMHYKSLIGLLNKHFESTGTNEFYLRAFDDGRASAFFRWLQTDRKSSNKTYNNYLSAFTTFVLWVMKKSKNLLKSNPLDALDRLNVITQKHASYNDEKLAALKKECIACGQDELLLFIQFIFYSLIRPGELRQLKVQSIDLAGNKIFIPGVISKNRYDEFVPISDDLRASIEASGILNKPKDHYIFGDTRMRNTRYFGKRNMVLLERLDFTDRTYDIYSYKHSGAIWLYNHTKDIMMVQRMCRHRTVQETQTYLRDLGLDVDYKTMLNGFKGAL